MELTSVSTAPGTTAPGTTARRLRHLGDELAGRSSQVEKIAFRLTGNRADAEDLRQDTMVRALRALRTADDAAPDNLDAWLRTLTVRLYLDTIRRRRRIAFIPLENDVVDTSAADLSDLLLADEMDDDVRSALAGISRDCRLAVLLRDVHGLAYAEIADLTGVRLTTVRSRIHRGRSGLRSALAHRA